MTVAQTPESTHLRDLLAIALRCLREDEYPELRERIRTALYSPLFDHTGQPLVPGALYCLFTYDPEMGSTGGTLAYYSHDGKLYDSETGEECRDDFDFLVRQVGDLNSEYIQDG